MISVTKEMKQILESERNKRLLDSIPERVRVILSELEWTPAIENAFSVFERMVLSVMLGHLHSCQELVGCHVSKR